MIDWDAARVAYIGGKETYAQIAQRFGVSKTSVTGRGKKERWPDQRRAFRKNVASRALASKANRETERLSRLMDSAEQLIGHLNRVTRDKDQFFRRELPFPEKRDEEDPESVPAPLEYISGIANTKALNNTTKALNELTKAVRNLYDIPTGEEKRAHNLAVRKLSIVEKKNHAGVDPDQYGVVLMPVAQLPDTDGAVEVDE